MNIMATALSLSPRRSNISSWISSHCITFSLQARLNCSEPCSWHPFRDCIAQAQCENKGQSSTIILTASIRRSYLKSANGGRLETKISLEILSNLTNETLKRQLADQQLSRFLITTNFTEGNSTRAVSVRLLHSSSGRCTLASGLRGKLLPGSLTTSGLASSLLCSSHSSTKRRKSYRSLPVPE